MDSEMEILFDFGVGANVPKRCGLRCFGKEDRFPVPSFRGRWRVGGLVLDGRRAGSLVLVSALLLLGLAVPDASAQPFTERNPAQDFNTLGVADGNKRPKGLWTDGTTMLVSDGDGRIYSYDVASKARQDDHHNDVIDLSKSEADKAGKNEDNFILYLHAVEDRTHTNSMSIQTINPYGIWANGSTNGSTLWAVHSPPRGDTNVLVKIYAYTITNKVSDVRDDLSGDERYWTGVRDSSKDIGPLKRDDREGNATTNVLNPTGIWSDGETMWVADNYGRNSRLYAYTISSKTRDRGKDIELAVGTGTGRQDAYDYTLDKNTSPQGIWSDGETMWVAEVAGATDSAEKRIYAYKLTLEEGETEEDRRVPEKDYKNLNKQGNVDDNDRPRGICSDGETMWVADITDNKLYAYHAFRKTHDHNPNEDFDRFSAAANHRPRGIWSDGETMWVTDDVVDKLYAYDLATKERAEDKEFTLKTSETDGKFPQGLWSDGETMYVAHFQRRRTNSMGEVTQAKESKIFAYNLTTKTRDPARDFDTLLTAGNQNPVGLWSNGTTMWVADSQDGKIYAYKMSDKSHDEGKDFDTLIRAGNENPKGIYSDGTTMWVADFDDDKIYAYKMSDKTRDAGKDFDTLKAAGNNAPFGIWSDNITTMWVLDSTEDKIYAYNTDAKARLGRLVLKGLVPIPGEKDLEVKLSPPFNNGTMSYETSVPYATERLTLETKALRPIDDSSPGGISYSRVRAVSNDDLEDVDNDKDGFQVDLTVGLNSFAIKVKNGESGSLPEFRTYRVDVTREFHTFNDPSKDIDLHADNANPRGVWANETTIWVADSAFTTAEGKKRLFAYKKSDGTRDGGDNGKDIDLDANNAAPQGICSDGTTMWVADLNPNPNDNKRKLYGYTISTKLRAAGKDIILDSNNANPRWIWSDGVTMWVSDSADNKLYAYKLSLEASETDPRDSNKDVSLAGRASGISTPTGMWADGASLWIADNGTDKIYAHKIKNNENAEDTIDCWEEVRDFNTLKAVDNLNPQAIFSDRSTMYVVDADDKKIYAYNQPLSTNNKLKSLVFVDEEGNENVYYDDQFFSQHFSSYETNYTNGIYVLYSTASTTVTAAAQEPDARVEVTEPADADPATPGYQINLSAEDTTEIVITVTAENGAQKNYTVFVHRKSGGRTPIRDFRLVGDNARAIGVWGNNTTIWVTDNGSKQIYAYNRDNGARDTSKEFMHTGTQPPKSIWGNGETIWVVNDYDARDNQKELIDGKLYAYNMWTNNVQGNPSWDGSRVPGKDIQLATSNPRGIWGNETTMWVAEEQGKLYAYKRDLGEGETEENRRVSAEDFNTLTAAENASPWGIWSTASVMWVLDWDDNKIYAYNSTTKGRLGNRNINGLEGTSGSSRGIWSDDTTMWVANGRNLYAYNLPQPGASANSGPSEDFVLSALRLSGIELSPGFSPDNLYYKVIVNHDVASTTVTATPNDSGATVYILWSSDRSATARTANRGRQVALSEGYNFIAVDVTAENGGMQSYVIWVTRAEAPPVSSGPLPVFQSQAVGGGDSTGATESSSTVLEKGESRLIFAETLPDGGVRFVFTVPAVEEFGIEETSDLLEEWRLLPDDEFKAMRESNVDGQDRLTIILPKAAGKQRFLRLMPQR